VKNNSAEISKALFTALLSVLLIFSGCRKKTPAPDSYDANLISRLYGRSEISVHILLEENIIDCLFETAGAFSITCPENLIPKASFEKTVEPVKIELRNGNISFGGWMCTASEIIITTDEPHIFTLNNSAYRGNLRLILRPDANSFDVINQLAIEPYLAGVIGAEMPSYWEAAALEAQTITARTYCLYIQNRFGRNRNWDLRRTQANQVYRGISAESPRIWRAVNQTIGLVLTCRVSDGNYDIFPTYYSSSCGGHTENSANVFGDSFEALVGVKCTYCKSTARAKDFNWPDVSFKKSFVNDRLTARYPKLKELETIVNISPASQSDYDDFTRLTRFRLAGSNGKVDFLRAEDFRLAIDSTGMKIKSTGFELKESNENWIFTKGRGFGHGVGFCQCGAQAMAREQKNAEEILMYYYPCSKLKKIY